VIDSTEGNFGLAIDRSASILRRPEFDWVRSHVCRN
jgi:hypothetical protein